MKKRIVERHTVLIGDKNECGHCEAGDKTLSRARPGYKYKYRYVPEGTKAAEKLKHQYGIKSDFMPAIIDCKKMDSGKEVCRKMIGFDARDWRDL